MLKQFVAGRHSNVKTVCSRSTHKCCYNSTISQFFEMMDMDEIHATTIKLNHFYRLPSVDFEDFSENIIPANIKDI